MTFTRLEVSQAKPKELVTVLTDNTVIIAQEMTFDEILKAIRGMAASLAELARRMGEE